LISDIGRGLRADGRDGGLVHQRRRVGKSQIVDAERRGPRSGIGNNNRAYLCVACGRERKVLNSQLRVVHRSDQSTVLIIEGQGRGLQALEGADVELDEVHGVAEGDSDRAGMARIGCKRRRSRLGPIAHNDARERDGVYLAQIDRIDGIERLFRERNRLRQ